MSLQALTESSQVLQQFSDGSYFVSDPTQDPSQGIQWYAQWYSQTPLPMPAEHRAVQLLPDGSGWTITWSCGDIQVDGLTFPLPAGAISWQLFLQLMCQDTKRSITDDQYNQITGQQWSGGEQATLARALADAYGSPYNTNSTLGTAFCYGLYVSAAYTLSIGMAYDG